MYVQSDTLLLGDVFENFRNICLEISQLDHARFLTKPGLTWQASLKKTEVRPNHLTDIDSLLMVENGFRSGTCQAICQHVKTNNKYMKKYDKNKGSLYKNYWDVNNLYRWEIFQTLPVYGFKWVEDISTFNEEFIKSYNDNNDKGYFLEVDVKYPKKLHNLHSDLPFFLERIKIEKVKKLVANLHDKEEYVLQIGI